MKLSDLENTDFDNTDRIHDWRNYVGANVQMIWESLPQVIKLAIALDADRLAGNEEWD